MTLEGIERIWKMKLEERNYKTADISYTIRSAEEGDRLNLSKLRLMIDGESEFLDRLPGEAFIDEFAFQALIKEDSLSPTNLFLLVEVDKQLIGFSRLVGSDLMRLKHKLEFGICIRKDYWGHGIGTKLLVRSIGFARERNFKKIELKLIASNTKAFNLYKKFGFELEGVLKKDKLLADGNYYDSYVMGLIL